MPYKNLNTKLKTTVCIIAACAVLHNIRLTYQHDINNDVEHVDRAVPAIVLEDRLRGQAIRAAFINRHFN